jgi:hypothetical protein
MKNQERRTKNILILLNVERWMLDVRNFMPTWCFARFLVWMRRTFSPLFFGGLFTQPVGLGWYAAAPLVRGNEKSNS